MAVEGFVFTKTMYITSVDGNSGSVVIAQIKDGAVTVRIVVGSLKKI